MNIHEYQAKALLKQNDIPVLPFAVVSTENEVLRAINEFGLKEAVIKVQIHAGGRGKAGGIRFAKNKEEIVRHSKELFGKKIINNQTGPKGLVAEKLIISAPTKIIKEYYVAAIIDRSKAEAYLIASREGGMDIEEIAKNKSEAIFKEPISLQGKLRSFQLLSLAKKMGWEKETLKEGMHIFAKLAKLFTESDATLFEINPLAMTEDGKLFAIDAKCIIDDNALSRQEGIASFFDSSQYTPNEVLASEYGLSYVGLDGNIGCMVNGAGLAMATMDILHYYGGSPSNFLDAGGGASLEKITQGFKLLLHDPQVKAIFVNIFGGIMDCAIIANGIVSATSEVKNHVPIVVRLEGTNVEQGKKILADSKLSILTADSMADGAKLAVKAITGK